MGRIILMFGQQINKEKKLNGVTPSERYLGKLCRRSFLSLWSYSNLYTDEGQKNGKGTGQELCDLLVIFENDIILFSDKYCEFNTSNPVDVSWRRWLKKAIFKSARQLHGAESWLRNHPNRIYLDKYCSKIFPFTIPDKSSMRVHRVAVAHGTHDACKAHFGGKSLGSLIIDTGITGAEHYKLPFHIGNIDPSKNYIHIFDDLTLDAVILELDTISDFISYLVKREAFLNQENKEIIATGEEQLLAIYLTKLNDKGEHDFVLPDGNFDSICFDESFWEGMVKNPQYVAKKSADEISYVWDKLVEHFISYGDEHTSSDPQEKNFNAQEKALRIMAAEPRLRRRQLGYALIHLMETTPSGKGMTRLMVSNDYHQVAYVFLIQPLLEGKTYQDYREYRKGLLLAYCKVAKLKANSSEFIVGIATEPKGSKGASEDLIVLETSLWTDEMQKEAESLQKDLSLFLDQNIKRTEGRYKEYPDLPKIKKGKTKN